MIQIELWSWSPRNTHCVWWPFHGSHCFIWDSFDDSHILWEGWNEPINIKNVDKVTVFQQRYLSVNDNKTITHGNGHIGTMYKIIETQTTYRLSRKNDDPAQVQLVLHSKSVQLLPHQLSAWRKVNDFCKSTYKRSTKTYEE